MRNVDTKQKNAAHVLHSFCFIKPAKKEEGDIPAAFAIEAVVVFSYPFSRNNFTAA